MSFEHRFIAGTGARTLLLLHGTGGDENDLIPLGQTLAPEANLLSVRGRVSEQGSNRFFRRFSEGVFDLDNMREETEALAGFLGEATNRYGFDSNEVFAVGFSNGANIATSMIFRFPELLRGGFLMRGMTPYVPEPLPDLAGLQILLASGEFDPIVPREDIEGLASLFVQAGADVEHLWVPVGHNLTRQEIEHATTWFAARP